MTAPDQEYLEELATAVANKVLASLAEQTDERPFLSTADVAARLRVDPRTVRNWMDSGRLASVKIEGVRRVRPGVLDEFVAGQGEPG